MRNRSAAVGTSFPPNLLGRTHVPSPMVRALYRGSPAEVVAHGAHVQ